MTFNRYLIVATVKKPRTQDEGCTVEVKVSALNRDDAIKFIGHHFPNLMVMSIGCCGSMTKKPCGKEIISAY
jgi:hypothetical protein